MNIKLLACAAFGLMLTANVFAQDEDMTHYIVNSGFDEDITWTVDGETKTIIGKETNLNDGRSEAWYTEDGSVYARSTGKKNRKDDIPSTSAWNGFIARIKGWDIVTNKTIEPPFKGNSQPEWVYFGSVPYGLGATAIPIADDGDTCLETPEKPDEDNGDDNKAAVYLRAGWGGSCVYKQTVKLPCAVYRLDYWVLNANYEKSKDNTSVKNLCQVTCRKDVFPDEDGFNAQVWTKHSITFTPTADFTIEFGFQSSGGSGTNPFIWIDGIKLYKVGEADPESLMDEDISNASDEIVAFAEEDLFSPFEGLQNEIYEIVDKGFDESLTFEQKNEVYKEMLAYIETLNNLKPVIEQYNGLILKAGNLLNSDDHYPGYDKLDVTIPEIQDEAESISRSADFPNIITELEDAIKDYYLSQEASEAQPADYTFFVPNPHFTKPGYEPTYSEGIATYPVDEQPTGRPEWESSEGWYKSGGTEGDQRLNWTQGRVCWNLWSQQAGYHAINMDLTDLPNGYYKVAVDMITQLDWVGEGYAHAFAKSTAAKSVSTNLTEGNFDGSMLWTTLTTEKVIVADGKLTIGGESDFPTQGQQMGWFCMSNVKLYYLGNFTDEDYKTIYDKTVADAIAMRDTMFLKGDIKIFTDSINAYKNATTRDEITEALAHLNSAIATATASEKKWNEVNHPNTGSWGNLKDSIAANVYSEDGTEIAQRIVDIMDVYVKTDTASYVYMDAKTAILRKYRDAYFPALKKAEAAEYTTKSAQDVIAVNLEAHIKELTAITDFPTAEEMDAYTAELNAAIKEANRLEALNAQQPGNNVDYTGLILNPEIIDDKATGWTVNKPVGDGNGAKSGQQYDGDGAGFYIDSYNEKVGALRYTAYQTLENIPNGIYEVKAMNRTSGNGAYLYAIADNDSTTAQFKHLQKNDFNYTKWVDPTTTNEAGTGDSIMITTDTYGPIWQESAKFVQDLGLSIYIDPGSGQTVGALIDEYIESHNVTDEQKHHFNIVKANEDKGRGWAWNTVRIEVKNHILNIGVTTDSLVTEGHVDTDGNECVPFTGTWFSADNFKLTMLSEGDNTSWDSNETGIEGVIGTENAVPVAIYNLNGVRIATPAKGINIIKMSDGTVKKVLVK